jgi:hypothetical protein
MAATRKSGVQRERRRNDRERRRTGFGGEDEKEFMERCFQRKDKRVHDRRHCPLVDATH